MRRLTMISWLITFFISFTFIMGLDEICLSQEGFKQKPGHEKIESQLFDLKSKYTDLGTSVLRDFTERGLLHLEEEKILVLIYLTDGKTLDPIYEAIKSLGGDVIKSGDRIIKAKIPLSNLESLASLKDISFIKLPDQPIPVYFSQGISLTGASIFHNSNIKGAGVKVAIIDLGFAGLSDSIRRGFLPNNVTKIDCTGASCEPSDFSDEYEIHGTAVAEIVHEMAPDAQLYLIKVGDRLDLKDAKDFCINNGIKIINHSVGWFNTNFYDGNCYFDNPVCMADHAFRNGILWVNSIGNHAKKHYESVFSDTDGDRLHNVSATNNYIALQANEGEVIVLALTWDRWPETSQDFDLLLFNSSFEIVQKSSNYQTGTQPPIEQLVYFVPHSGTYYVAIQRFIAKENPRFKLFSFYHDLTPYVARGSLLSPSDARGVLAISAINYVNWEAGPPEEFSSQGPTTDGRIKPEISGPDGVSNFSYGTFYGTSASAPYVAGASALLLSAHNEMGAQELWEILTSSAIDLGQPGQDNIYGYGKLNLSSMHIDPPYLNFGSVEIGTPSVKNLLIENRIQTPLAVTQIYPLNNPYQIVEDNCTGKTLAQKESCLVRIGFFPQQIGDFSDNLRILSTDPIQSLKTVSISGKGTATISLISPDNGLSINPCSAMDHRQLIWSSSYPFNNYEVQFSREVGFWEVPIKIKIVGNQNSIVLTRQQLKKIFDLAGENGGEVYWRIIGSTENGSSIISNVHSLSISSPIPVGDWTISSTKRSDLPVISWKNNCNKKVRVWFGRDPNFNVSRSFTYYPSPVINSFQKSLTKSQWKSIRALVDDQSGIPIYWFIESWDTMNRYSSTSIRFFFLLD